MRILVPIAGAEPFFPPSEYHFPKPLVEIAGVPMIVRVIENLRTISADAEFVFVIPEDQQRDFGLADTLLMATDGRCHITQLHSPTKGAACSALMAIEHIRPDEPLIVANGDQVFEVDLAARVTDFVASDDEAAVLTFESVHPRWSYVRSGADGSGDGEAAEKRVLSRDAIAGFYYFRSGARFIDAAKRSIAAERHVNGVYYIAPVLNEIILDGEPVRQTRIESSSYHSLYTPQRVEQYERHLQTPPIGDSSSRGDVVEPLTVLIPMAGKGTRFGEAGYDKPKPFIDVDGKPMIERVLDNLAIPEARHVLLARPEHLQAELVTVARLRARGDITFVPVDVETEGAASTLLFGRAHMGQGAVMLANSDQVVDFAPGEFLSDMRERELDGSILVFDCPERDPKWSYAEVDRNGVVVRVAEKEPISRLATVGIYLFASGTVLLDSIVEMIIRNDRTKNEFYTCPAYNHAIANGHRIGVYEVPREAMHGLGTPEDLEAYLGAVAR